MYRRAEHQWNVQGDKVMDRVLEEFSSWTKKPETFLGADGNSSNGLKSITKSIFDVGASCLKDRSVLPIEELIVDGFDDEQIWQELELLNGIEWPALTREVSQATARRRQLRLSVQTSATADADAEADSGNAEDGDRGPRNESFSDEDAGLEEDDVDAGYEEAQGSEDDDGREQDSEEDSGGGEESEDEGGGDESGGEEPMPALPRGPRSAVDDQFFRLGELEQFLERQDRQFDRERMRKPDQASEGQGGVDLFTADAGDEVQSDDEGDGKMPMYSDFFDPPAGSDPLCLLPQSETTVILDKRKDLLASDSEGEDAADILGNSKKAEPKSSLEARQERLKARISQLEEVNLAEKPWQLRGETTAAGRHENALLEEFVDFEQTRRAPVTTAEVTAEIERLILRRIKDAAFDDVERKVKQVTDPYDFKKRLVLDQEKSKLSLAQIYEQEYLKQKADAEAKPEVDLSIAHDESEDVPKEHEEIKKLMSELFAKLDTLTHFHYQPKQASAEVRIISKLPSIAMEEVTPLSASNATLLAPEEIKDKKRSQLLAKEERTDTDKKRERRKKKRLQSTKAHTRELKERALSTSAPEKRGAAADKRLAEAHVARAVRHGTVSRADENPGKKALKSSSAFFSQLQDQMTSQLAPQPPAKKKRKRATAQDVSRMRL